MSVSFTVPGIPVPKARARVMRGGWSFTPKKTMEAQTRVRMFATMALKGVKSSIFGPQFKGSLFCRVLLFGARKNADLDNLYKTVTDALQGVLYYNDCQIDHAEIVRQTCGKGQERTVITIEEIPCETN